MNSHFLRGWFHYCFAFCYKLQFITSLWLGSFEANNNSFQSSNFTLPRELRGTLSSLLSKLSLKKQPVGKESQWLLMCCQVQHPYLFKGLVHKEISLSVLTDSIYLGFQSIKALLVPKMFCEMILMCSMIYI